MALNYLRMLPCLEARESLRRISEGVAADSMIKPAQRRRIINAFQEEAVDPFAPKPKAVIPPTKEEWERSLAQMGVQIVHVAKPKQEDIPTPE